MILETRKEKWLGRQIRIPTPAPCDNRKSLGAIFI